MSEITAVMPSQDYESVEPKFVYIRHLVKILKRLYERRMSNHPGRADMHVTPHPATYNEYTVPYEVDRPERKVALLMKYQVVVPCLEYGKILVFALTFLKIRLIRITIQILLNHE